MSPGFIRGVFAAVSSALALTGGLAPAAFATSPTENTGLESAPPESAPLAMVPPPTSVSPSAGAPTSPGSDTWAPDATTRILITTQDLSVEASRLAEELSALGLVDVAPEIYFDELGKVAEPTDILLTDSTKQSTLSASDTGLVVSGADSSEVFRVTRPLLQQLVATGSVPDGTYTFNLPADQIRAVHIDIARKHYPIESLETLLYQMSWYGMNELELHFSENEGFAIASVTHPDIASADAHSQEAIEDLVALANLLHIRVAPSLDMPGHLDYALNTYPELRLRDSSGGEVFGALDITNADALAFADDLIGEFTVLFDQPQFNEPVPWHLGGDEFVNFADQHEVAALTGEAQREYGADATAYDALTAFVNATASKVRDAGFQPRVFSDGMLRSSVVELDPEIEVSYWTQRPPGAVTATEFADAGYELVNMNDEYLYFVLGERVEYYYPTGQAILAHWDDTVYPEVDGAAEIIGASKGGILAIWSDIPEALTADEVVDAVRVPIAAMAVKFAVPDTSMTFDELESALAASGLPPRVVVAGVSDAVPPLAMETTPPPAVPSESDSSAGGGSGSQWMWWTGSAIAIAVVALATIASLRGKRSQRS